MVLLFYIKPIYLLIHSRYQNEVAGKEIYHSIQKSKQKQKHKKIILGDSTGYQLFPNKEENDTINSLACNQAIEMVGQYILLRNYIESGNKIDIVYMLFNPFRFRDNLNQVYTFHYFLKPFYKKENVTFFSEKVHNQISKIPFYYLCREPYILTSNWAPNFVNRDTANYTFISPISVEYLNKMKSLAHENNFKLIILPTPTDANFKVKIDKLNQNEIAQNDLVEEFKSYFSSIIYLNDSLFVDGIHLKDSKKYRDLYKKNWIN